MGRMTGKVALVTGAARGQGRSHAVALAQEGASIVAVDLCDQIASVPYRMARPGDLTETAHRIKETGGDVLARQADVRDSGQLASVVSAALDQFGHIDIVCANAGILSSSPVAELSDELWDDMIAVNLTGVFRTIRSVLPAMIEQGTGGSIIITSSTAGSRGFPNLAHYTAAKHGVIGLMRSLVNEVSPHRIRVNVLQPSSVDTDMIQHEHVYRLFEPDNPAPDRRSFGRAHSALHPLGIPWLEPIDVSNAVVWLASDEARYVTGVCLPVDAGLLERLG
jgi:SDR family mycofactocin-dependent oxidoreductase